MPIADAKEEQREEAHQEGRRRALFIRVSKYNNNSLQPLDFCKKDAEEMSLYCNSAAMSNFYGDNPAGEYTASTTYNKQVAEMKFNLILSRT